MPPRKTQVENLIWVFQLYSSVRKKKSLRMLRMDLIFRDVQAKVMRMQMNVVKIIPKAIGEYFPLPSTAHCNKKVAL